jgi:nitrite reductase/ring-hydroxylating ferredoxin subunit
MGWIKRIFGISDTPLPQDQGSWQLGESGEVVVDLACTPEISKPGSAIRLEGQGLGERILVIHDADGTYRAFGNRCTHMRRRIDLLDGGAGLMCCSVSKSRFSFEGEVLGGPAKGPIKVFPVEMDMRKLHIKLS